MYMTIIPVLIVKLCFCVDIAILYYQATLRYFAMFMLRLIIDNGVVSLLGPIDLSDECAVVNV
jgi:hypothetical protein